MSHRCPGPDCDEQVDDAMLMCRQHWYLVPPPIRNAVRRAWKGSAGAGSTEHVRAIHAAIQSVNPEGR
jgi:hypothetical protein